MKRFSSSKQNKKGTDKVVTKRMLLFKAEMALDQAQSRLAELNCIITDIGFEGENRPMEREQIVKNDKLLTTLGEVKRELQYASGVLKPGEQTM